MTRAKLPELPEGLRPIYDLHHDVQMSLGGFARGTGDRLVDHVVEEASKNGDRTQVLLYIASQIESLLAIENLRMDAREERQVKLRFFGHANF
jgi:hypothetical protein